MKKNEQGMTKVGQGVRFFKTYLRDCDYTEIRFSIVANCLLHSFQY